MNCVYSVKGVRDAFICVGLRIQVMRISAGTWEFPVSPLLYAFVPQHLKPFVGIVWLEKAAIGRVNGLNCGIGLPTSDITINYLILAEIRALHTGLSARLVLAGAFSSAGWYRGLWQGIATGRSRRFPLL
jgi:hypothetical protein